MARGVAAEEASDCDTTDPWVLSALSGPCWPRPRPWLGGLVLPPVLRVLRLCRRAVHRATIGALRALFVALTALPRWLCGTSLRWGPSRGKGRGLGYHLV